MNRKKTILVAEDEEFNFILIEEILSVSNLEILWAPNGLLAVEMFESRNDIDLILMDIKMPFMSGIEATSKIKSINKSVPIIAQTAFAMEEDEHRFRKLGFDDYITKPLCFEKLIHKVEFWLAKSLCPEGSIK